jgi:hypothetical protein
MFTVPTVLVLGAGAGCDVGMPAGPRLKELIAKKLSIKYTQSKLKSGDPQIAGILKRQYGETYNEWRIAGCMVAEGMDYTNSIDDYLQTHHSNEKIAICAKLANRSVDPRARTRVRTFCQGRRLRRLEERIRGSRILVSGLLPATSARGVCRAWRSRCLQEPLRHQFQLRPLF